MSRKKVGKAISVFTALLTTLLVGALFSDSVVHSIIGISVIGVLAFLCGFFLLKAFFFFWEEHKRSLHGLLKAGYIFCLLLILAILAVTCFGESPNRNSGFLVAALSFVIGMLVHEVSQTDMDGGGWI